MKVRGLKVGDPCPRCGRPISWFETRRVGNREYDYAAHYNSKKKSKRDLCYLGPKGRYVYVTKTHEKEGLILKGLSDPNRVLEYLEILLKRILIDERLKEEVKKRYSGLFKELIK